MKSSFKALMFAGLLLASASAQAAIVTREVPYKDGDVELLGYLAYDDARKSPLPGVLVIHEWWGHNDYARKRAEQLAGLGYAAFAGDMYGAGKKAETPDQAKVLSKPFYEDRKLMRRRAAVALDVLKSQPNVDKDKTAAIGYCFGGTVALELARSGADTKGVVSFHGGLATPVLAKEGDVKAEVLALNGAEDALVPGPERLSFIDEMTKAKVKFKSIDYPRAGHAFTNPAATEVGKKFKLPVSYNAEADKSSWSELEGFLAKIFGN